MKVLLTAINAKYIHSNLAVYDLRAYAKKMNPELGKQIEIAEYTINQYPEQVLMDLYRKKPDVICFSCYIWNIQFIERLLEDLKKIMPEVPIWLGGPEVSYDAVQTLHRFPYVDGIMKGEGEETFALMMEQFLKNNQKMGKTYIEDEDLENIQGITYRKADGQIVENPWREIMDLSAIPFVYEDLELFQNKIIYYESSRGCPFSCSYCLSSVDKCLRFRDIELVKKELQFFLDAGVPQVKFVDRTFNCKHDHAKAIWRYLLEHDTGKTNFHFEVSADLLDEEELKLISQMRPGLIQLEIGVQSTNESTITEINRTMNLTKLEGIVNRIHSFENVHQHLDLIAGLPYEDYERFKQSFDEIHALKPNQLQLGFLKVLKGSQMYEKREDYGLVYKSEPPYEVLYTNWMSYEDILRLKEVEEMVELYYNSNQFVYTLSQILTRYSSPFDFYEQLGTFYRKKGYHLMNHSRISRYEILLEFLVQMDSKRRELYLETMKYDLYLREDLKKRPDFLLPLETTREEKRETPKGMHLEHFHYHPVTGEKKECRCLFNYKERSPLTKDAKVTFFELAKNDRQG